MLLICPTEQARRTAAHWHDGQFAHDAYASIARRPPPPRAQKQIRKVCVDRAAHIVNKPAMAKKPGTNPKGEFAFFDVVYEDGSQRSNRRVPAELLGGLDGDEPARGYILEQDREIAEKSGRAPLAIKSISRVGAKKK
jgi:hypothetical protein